MVSNYPYNIFSLSDQAITIDFGNIISDAINDVVISLFKHLQQHPVEGMIEAVPAYSSLTIYYDMITLRKKVPEEKSVFDWIKSEVSRLFQQKEDIVQVKEKLVSIPVCYEKEFASDIQQASTQLQIPVEEIIRIHTSKTYRVYMLGFLPGFAYMGEVDDAIALPRKPQPVQVEAGSVGIAGKQTGVYPFNSSGGWQIIGKTPINMFNKSEKELTALKAGDRIKFYSISVDEFIFLKTTPPLPQERGLGGEV